jgi:hypothetical protein
LALDGHTQTPSLAVLLRVTEKYSESAETPVMTSPMSPMMEEWMPYSIVEGQLVLAVE